MRFEAIWMLIGGLVAWPAVCQEPRDQVSLQVPEAVVFPVTNLHSKAAALSTLLTFDHARLARGSRLRISVRAEGLDFGAGTPARISYAAHARGGTPFNCSLRDTDYTPVFESDPRTLSGSVEIGWSLEPLGRVDRSGNRTVTLRWKAESIPDTAGRPATGVSHPEPDATAPPDRGEREGPGRRSRGRPGRRLPPAKPAQRRRSARATGLFGQESDLTRRSPPRCVKAPGRARGSSGLSVDLRTPQEPGDGDDEPPNHFPSSSFA